MEVEQERTMDVDDRPADVMPPVPDRLRALLGTPQRFDLRLVADYGSATRAADAERAQRLFPSGFSVAAAAPAPEPLTLQDVRPDPAWACSWFGTARADREYRVFIESAFCAQFNVPAQEGAPPQGRLPRVYGQDLVRLAAAANSDVDRLREETRTAVAQANLLPELLPPSPLVALLTRTPAPRLQNSHETLQQLLLLCRLYGHDALLADEIKQSAQAMATRVREARITAYSEAIGRAARKASSALVRDGRLRPLADLAEHDVRALAQQLGGLNRNATLHWIHELETFLLYATRLFAFKPIRERAGDKHPAWFTDRVRLESGAPTMLVDNGAWNCFLTPECDTAVTVLDCSSLRQSTQHQLQFSCRYVADYDVKLKALDPALLKAVEEWIGQPERWRQTDGRLYFDPYVLHLVIMAHDDLLH